MCGSLDRKAGGGVFLEEVQKARRDCFFCTKYVALRNENKTPNEIFGVYTASNVISEIKGRYNKQVRLIRSGDISTNITSWNI